MKLYHTSNVRVPSPDTRHSRDHLDFGRWKEQNLQICIASQNVLDTHLHFLEAIDL